MLARARTRSQAGARRHRGAETDARHARPPSAKVRGGAGRAVQAGGSCGDRAGGRVARAAARRTTPAGGRRDGAARRRRSPAARSAAAGRRRLGRPPDGGRRGPAPARDHARARGHARCPTRAVPAAPAAPPAATAVAYRNADDAVPLALLALAGLLGALRAARPRLRAAQPHRVGGRAPRRHPPRVARGGFRAGRRLGRLHGLVAAGEISAATPSVRARRPVPSAPRSTMHRPAHPPTP